MGELFGSVFEFLIKDILFDLVFIGLGTLLWSAIKGWVGLWVSFFELFLYNKPELSQVLGIIFALIINPITISILIYSWQDLVSSAVATGSAI